jgi:putative spermidine/putrescine transport system permease protein
MSFQSPAFGAHPDAVETVADAAAPAATRRPRRSLGSLAWWVVFIAGVVYFALPLIGTFNFSLKSQPFLSAYTAIFDDPKFVSSLIYSFAIGLITIVVSIAIIVPTAFWVRLKVPRARPAIEFITLLPFVIPPIVLVFGLISTYSHPPLPFTHTDLGSSALLVAGYVILSFPYMYRAVDTGLRAIDIQSLTEASQSLGAGWLRIMLEVILPNLRVALLSGAFLTLAIVIGEFTMAIFLARPAFAPYLSLLGDSKPYQQAAVALISFGLTWIAMGFIALLGRGSRSRITVAGAR